MGVQIDSQLRYLSCGFGLVPSPTYLRQLRWHSCFWSMQEAWAKGVGWAPEGNARKTDRKQQRPHQKKQNKPTATREQRTSSNQQRRHRHRQQWQQRYNLHVAANDLHTWMCYTDIYVYIYEGAVIVADMRAHRQTRKNRMEESMQDRIGSWIPVIFIHNVSKRIKTYVRPCGRYECRSWCRKALCMAGEMPVHAFHFIPAHCSVALHQTTVLDVMLQKHMHAWIHTWDTLDRCTDR